MSRAGAPGTLRTGLAGDGWLRWVAVDVAPALADVRDRLDLSPIATAALGQALASAALLFRLSLKSLDRISIEIRGDGPLRKVYAEADLEGNLRGAVGEPQLDLPPQAGGGLAVNKALGQGMLKVRRELPEQGAYESQVALSGGEMANQLAHFLAQSEQTRSAVLLGVLLKPQGIRAAGGIIVEAFPGVAEETLSKLEANIGSLPGVGEMFDQGGIDGALARVFEGVGFESLDSQDVRYRCRCSRGRLLEMLESLPREELQPLRSPEDGTIPAECGFCGAVYRYAIDEISPN
ncbi:MAG TPA: Hsp33 family molecular chaperone HslO [Thermoanaerobaculia bacterium]|nr:Hsp33 family molecular chaperone HslO [Thermoanaerobaculia bacterium]